MADVGATLSPHGEPKPEHLGLRQRSGIGSIAGSRRLIVAAALASGDLVVGLVGVVVAVKLLDRAGAFEAESAIWVPVCIQLLMLFTCGLYTGCGPSPYERFRMRVLAIAGFVAIDFTLHLPLHRPALVVMVEACQAGALLVLGHYMESAVRNALITAGVWGAPTALVGKTDHSGKLAALLNAHPEIGLRPVAFADPHNEDIVWQTKPVPIPLLSSMAELGAIRPPIEVVIFNSADELAEFTADPRTSMPASRLMLVEDVHEVQSLWVRSRMLGWAIGLEIRRERCQAYNRLIKRALDLILAVPLAVLAAPVVAVLALLVKVIDPGPWLFIQERVGRDGSPVPVFKLRTMYLDAEQRLQEQLARNPALREEWQKFFKLERDPRILPIIGSLMRRASLDELPQLWNVIRGEMSLVGPRPFPSYHLNSFDAEFRNLRATVQPGITGMWQVSSRSNGDLEKQKAEDLFYIRNWSVWLDVYILLETLPAVLCARGAK